MCFHCHHNGASEHGFQLRIIGDVSPTDGVTMYINRPPLCVLGGMRQCSYASLEWQNSHGLFLCDIGFKHLSIGFAVHAIKDITRGTHKKITE